jgi:nitroimidazol reductase NimA-like FMN-containing flavoprotein (pyridoxamine 5'-phosphate oxidase superfamily)
MGKSSARDTLCPPMSKEEIDSFLKQPLIGKIASFNRDGTIHVTPCWYSYEEGTFTMVWPSSKKAANVQRNGNITFLVDSVIASGKATANDKDVLSNRLKMFSRYLPSDQAQGMAKMVTDSWPGVVVRMKPEKVTSFDYSKGALVTPPSTA